MAQNEEVKVNINFDTNAEEATKDVEDLGKAIDDTADSTKKMDDAMKSNRKSVLDNGGAMGLLNDLTGGYAGKIKDAIEASELFTFAKKADTAATNTATAATTTNTLATTASTLALKGLRIALAATGIGLLIIAAGILAANWDRVTGALKDVLPSMDKVKEVMAKVTEVARGVGQVIVNYVVAPFKALAKVVQGDFKGALEEIKNGFDVVGSYQEGAAKERLAQQEMAQKKALESLIKSEEDKLEVLKAAGKDTYTLALKISKDKQKLYKDDKDKLAEALQEEKVIRAEHQKKLGEDAQKASDKAAKDAKDAKDAKEKADEAAKKKAEEDAKLKLEIYNQEQKDLKEILGASQKELNDANDAQDARDLTMASGKFAQMVQNYEDDTAAKKAKAKADKEINDAVEALGWQALSVAKDLFGKNKAVQKGALLVENGVAGARVVMDTIKAVSADNAASPLTLGMPWSAIHIAQGALGLTSIISATNKGLQALGGGSAGSPPSLSATAGGATAQPNVSFQASSSNQLAGAFASSKQGSDVIKAYVVASEVTTQQSLDANKVTSTSL